jgi:hypothetical protein
LASVVICTFDVKHIPLLPLQSRHSLIGLADLGTSNFASSDYRTFVITVKASTF